MGPKRELARFLVDFSTTGRLGSTYAKLHDPDSQQTHRIEIGRTATMVGI